MYMRRFILLSVESLERVKQLTGRVVPFLKIDLLHDDLRGLFKDTFTKDITGIIHCAGLKAVGESSVDPLKYYENNFVATLRLLRAIEKYIDDHKIGDTYQGAETCVDFIFSSSAMVYGHSEIIPIPEGSPCLPTSPYGMSKLSVENLLKDFSASLMRKYNHKENVYFKGINLRYFNPVGAHPSGILGEHPHGIPNNLFPYLGQVAMGRLGQLSVFGDDYPETHDGTGIRDYIHIMDLVEGHVDALEYLQRKTIVTDMIQGKLEPCQDLNLGLGKGYSVLDMISAFEKASGQKIPFQVIIMILFIFL